MKRARNPREDGLIMDEVSKEKIHIDIDIQPNHLQPQHVPKSYFGNKADKREEIDKVLDFIYALSAITEPKKIWEPHHQFLKFMRILPNKRKKKDDMSFQSFMLP